MSVRRLHVGRWQALATVTIACVLAGLEGATAASAQAPYWKLSSRSAPTNLPLAGEQLVGEKDSEPGHELKGEGVIVASAVNLGATSVNATKVPVTISDQLPPGVEIRQVEAQTGRGVPGGKGLPVKLSCPEVNKATNKVACTFNKELTSFEQLEIRIWIKITATEPSRPLNEVTVTGGETTQATLKQPLNVVGNGGATPFGVEAYELTPENEDGSIDNQAGTHPFQLTTTFNLNQAYGFYKEFETSPGLPQAPALQKDLEFRIPPGLLGNPTAMPQCSGVDFGALDANAINSCAGNTAIGVASVTFNDPILIGLQTWSVPVFNLVPAPGEPAKFGFEIVHVPVVLDTAVRTGEDYGVNVSVKKTPESVQVLGATVTLWGTPGDASHDSARGWNCLGNSHYVAGLRGEAPCRHGEFPNPQPFLLLPTSCASPLATSVTGDAWPRPPALTGETLSARNEPPWAKSSQPVALDKESCSKLPFNPSISVRSDQTSGSTPTGMTVEVNMPQQETTLAVGQLAEGDIKDTVLALPPGVAASAGAADGLGTCGVGEAGGFFGPIEAQRFTPDVPTCPDAAKIGTVEVNTPLLPHPLNGSLYLGTQNTNPFASPLVLYLIATEEEPIHHEGSKVLVKLAGEVRFDQNTGQLTSVFKNTPQTPFEHLRIHLFDGPRAAQSTPDRCGAYNASALFTAWNEVAPNTFKTAPAGGQPGEGFQITSGPGGGACPGAALPFAPGFQAGSMNPKAGAFTPFVTTIGRPDGNQALQSITIHLPTGLAAVIASVNPCPSTQSTCGPDSLIGEATIRAGLGPDPVTLHGQVYFTGPYKGAPFGLLAVTPNQFPDEGMTGHQAPLYLTDIPKVRSAITVDPYTAAATITSDPIPPIVKGVPSQIKELNVAVTRPNFQFNPTNCNPLAITGVLGGWEGTPAAVSSPFRVVNCGKLQFNPTFEASTQAETSKANGASLTVRVRSGGLGVAGIIKTKVALPIALPSRLTTIQKACLAKVFEDNPISGCPDGSNIGTAIIHTPVFRNPLTGKAFLVSHGSEAFPDVEFVLQGEGVLVILDGKTDIKKGITTSSFESLPDAPFSEFLTVLPEGPHSALAANGDLCTQQLTMPTTITSQNGAVIQQETKMQVTGCHRVQKFKVESKLAKALKKCRTQFKHNRRKRAACEAQARKRFGPKKASSKHKH